MAAIPIAGEVLNQSALVTGFLAGAVAVGGFVAHSRAVLRDRPEAEIQRSMAAGGLQGLAFGLMLIVIDTIAG
jgi:hypothetical protein